MCSNNLLSLSKMEFNFKRKKSVFKYVLLRVINIVH
jgi:hypothetical protein